MRHDFLRYRCALNFKFESKTTGQRVAVIRLICQMAMVVIVTVCLSNVSEIFAQVQERARWLLLDIAKVTLNSSGQSQIDFNPAICRRLGPDLCEYFRAHEYGHVNLRHLERGVATRQAEHEADIWAARNASSSAVEAARQYFEKGRGGSRYHGSAQERAQRLSKVQMNQKAGNPVEKRVTIIKPSTVSTTFSKTRAITQYSGGSRKAIVRQTLPSRTRKVIYIVKSAPSTARPRVPKTYIPKGGFNNPNR